MAKQTNLSIAVEIVRQAGTITKENKSKVSNLIMDTLKVSKANAGVYLFKARAIVDGKVQASVKTEKAPKVFASVKEISNSPVQAAA